MDLVLCALSWKGIQTPTKYGARQRNAPRYRRAAEPDET